MKIIWKCLILIFHAKIASNVDFWQSKNSLKLILKNSKITKLKKGEFLEVIFKQYEKC